MPTPIQRSVIGLVLLIITIVGLFVWKVTTPAFFSKEQLQEHDIFLFPQPRDIPPISWIDQNGKPFTDQQLKGKWTFIFFGFTSCGQVCPTSLSQLGRVADAMSAKTMETPLQYLFFSVDPKRDTPEKIAEYVSVFNKSFIGVTAAEKELPAIGAALNVVVDVPKEHDHEQDHRDHAKQNDKDKSHDHDHAVIKVDEIDHSANVVIINPNGQYAGFIRGGFKAEQVIPYLPSVLHHF